MKILIVAQYYRPDITAAAFRIAETADILVNDGHEVVVVTSEPHRGQAAAGATSGTAGTSGALPTETRFVADRSVPSGNGSLTVYRVPIDPLQGAGMRPYLRHFFSFVFRGRRAVKRLRRDGYRPDVIWTSSPPLFVGLIGTAARRWFRAPLVLDVRDVWPDTAVAAGQISRDGRAYAFGRKMEHWIYRRSDAFTCVAKPMAAYLAREVAQTARENRSLEPSIPIDVVYNGVYDAAANLPSAEAIERRVLYAGNLGRLQGVDALIRAWADVVASSNGVPERTTTSESFAKIGPAAPRGWRLEIVGGGVMEEELRRVAAEVGISDSVTFHGILSKEETLEMMQRSGVLFLNLIPDPVFDLTIPSKLFDYLAVGRPIIGAIQGEGRQILTGLPGNYAVTPNDVSAIADVLQRVMSAEDWESSLPGNQAIVRRDFTRAVNARRLLSLFERLSTST